MTIICNVTGSERKRLADVLGATLLMEPIYKKAPTFAYVVSDYTIDKNGTIFCPVSASVEDVARIVAKLNDEGFTPEIEGIESVAAEDEAPAEIPAETPDIAPEAEAGAMPEAAAAEATVGAETPDEAVPEEDATTEADQSTEEVSTEDDQPLEDAPDSTDAEEDAQPDENQDEDSPDEANENAEVEETKLTISIPRDKLADDALARLRTMVSNKEVLFKRALLADALPIEVTEDKVSFPWFTLTGTGGEAEAYAQFITALCQMATEQTRVLDKPYDGDNDRFAMRIFMVRLGMKGAEFALARKLMMKHLTGNSGWRYEDSASRPDRSNPIRSTVQHLKKAYPNGSRIEIIPMNDVGEADIHIGDHGTMIGVDDNGSVFVRLANGSAFGIAFCTEQTEEDEEVNDPAPAESPEESASDVPLDTESAEESEAVTPEEEADAPAEDISTDSSDDASAEEDASNPDDGAADPDEDTQPADDTLEDESEEDESDAEDDPEED